jgi:hypothetical protein
MGSADLVEGRSKFSVRNFIANLKTWPQDQRGGWELLEGDISEKNATEFGRWPIFRIRSNDRLVLGTAFGQNPEKRPPFPGRDRYRLSKSPQPPGNAL